MICFNIGGRVGSRVRRVFFADIFFFFLSITYFLTFFLPSFFPKQKLITLISSVRPLLKVYDHRWHLTGKWRASLSESALHFPVTVCNNAWAAATSCCIHPTVDLKISRYLSPFTGGQHITPNLGDLFPIASHMEVVHWKPIPRPADGQNPKATRRTVSTTYRWNLVGQSGNPPIFSWALKTAEKFHKQKQQQGSSLAWPNTNWKQARLGVEDAEFLLKGPKYTSFFLGKKCKADLMPSTNGVSLSSSIAESTFCLA